MRSVPTNEAAALSGSPQPYATAEGAQRLVFASGRGIGTVRSDGSDCRLLAVQVPGETRWQCGPQYRDETGRSLMLLFSHGDASIARLVRGAARRRVWVRDAESGRLNELFTGSRPAPWMGVSAVFEAGRRAIVHAIIDGEQRLFTADLRTGRCEVLTEPGSGFHYGESLSPDATRLACHVTYGKGASVRPPAAHLPAAYSINVIDLATHRRTLVAGQPGHLYFGPVWSPDGRRLAFLDCESHSDPAHFWADVCVAEADGSACRRITAGQSHWFATSHGTAAARGGGSNFVAWVPGGTAGLVAWTPRLPGSRPDVIYDPERADHEEFVFAPERARGGTYLQLLDPDTAEARDLTPPEEGRWDFRVAFACDGRRFAYCRTRPGQSPELWVGEDGGAGGMQVSRGLDGQGADFPVWLE